MARLFILSLLLVGEVQAQQIYRPVAPASQPVTSVHGRTGAVVATEGDYLVTQMGDVTALKGNATVIQMFGGGATATNDCAKFDANGNIVSTGAACNAGSVTNVTGSAPISSSGGATPQISCPTCVTSGAAMTASQVIIGSGSQGVQASGKTLPAGSVVGDTDAQTLTNKVISGASNTLTVREADFSFTDITTANATNLKHGLLPKLSNNAAQYLNGTGAFSAPAGVPGGADTQVQFNDSSAFGGSSKLTFNKTTGLLTLQGSLSASDGTVSSGVTLTELAANGSNYSAIYAQDSLTSDGCILMPDGSPTNGQILKGTANTAVTTDGKTCRIMQWAADATATPIQTFVLSTVRVGDGIMRPANAVTQYLPLGGGAATGAITDEGWVKTPIAQTGTMQNACVRTFGAQDGGGTLVVTLRKNAADTAIVITIGAGAAEGTYCDTTHTDTLSGGTGTPDLLDWKVLQNGALSAYIATISVQLQ